MILENGCNITKSEKFKGVWILSVPTVYIQTRFQKSWDTVQIVNKNNAMMWKFHISIFYSEYNIDDIKNV